MGEGHRAKTNKERVLISVIIRKLYEGAQSLMSIHIVG